MGIESTFCNSVVVAAESSTEASQLPGQCYHAPEGLPEA
jgi:hypothetical protein